MRSYTTTSGEAHQRARPDMSRRVEYLPFGELLIEEKHAQTERSNYLFNGKELDSETGWYYYGARYYDPKVALWLSVDPLAEKYAGCSSYSYTFDNPINLVDPDGKLPCPPGPCLQFGKGVAKGLWGGMKSTWNFITHDAWKADTWKATGNVLLGAAILSNAPGVSLQSVDTTLGTNTAGAFSGINTAIDNTVSKLKSGDPESIGEVVGQVLWIGVEAAAGSKGAGMLTKSRAALGGARNAAKGVLQLESSAAKVMGNNYKAAGEVTSPIKNTELLTKLNATSKGDWVKVYEAGLQNGSKIKTHYFRNNTTG